MKKIGFIDFYLDEWHANNYPKWIKDASGGDMQVAYAYGMIDSPKPGGLTSAGWCEKNAVALCNSIADVVEMSDYLVVLSPDNCEYHEELSEMPLRSGKPTFIDKTFAPDGDAAARIFETAEKYNTPCYSSSALRYATEYTSLDKGSIQSICSWGPGELVNYSIHQLEPILMLMGTEVKRVLYTGGEGYLHVNLEFNDRRYAVLSCLKEGSPFMMNIAGAENQVITAQSDYFGIFIAELIEFFKTGKEPISHAETTAIMRVREACLKAGQMPGMWVDVA